MDMHIDSDKKRLIIIGVAALAVIALGWFLISRIEGPLPEVTTFQGKSFAFTYPRTYDLQEYATGVVTLSRVEASGPMPVVGVVRYKSDPDVALPPSFDAFAKRQAANLCGSDQAETVTCGNPVAEPVTTDTGLTGTKLSLTLTRKNLATGAATTTPFGPIYVFDTTAPATVDSPLRYQGIFIYPALNSVLAASTTPELVDQVMNSLTIPGKGVATTTP
jgi:hypothetical protein